MTELITLYLLCCVTVFFLTAAGIRLLVLAGEFDFTEMAEDEKFTVKLAMWLIVLSPFALFLGTIALIVTIIARVWVVCAGGEFWPEWIIDFMEEVEAGKQKRAQREST